MLTALEKLPADRFATAAEFAEALRDKGVFDDGSDRRGDRGAAEHGDSPPAPGCSSRRSPPRSCSPRPPLFGVGSARRRPPLMSQFSLALKPNQALQPPSTVGGGRIALSPDGRALVYSRARRWGSRLWLRRIDQLDADTDRRYRGRLEPVLLAGRQAGGIHQERHRGADRVARRARRRSR